MKQPEHMVGITGASGSILAIRLIEELLKAGKPTGVIVSDAGQQTMGYELFRDRNANLSIVQALEKRDFHADLSLLTEYDSSNLFAWPASGGSSFTSMTVIPASMKTVAALSHGYADSLLTRAMDVAFKEKRTTIIVPRENPVHAIHLENMERLARLGALVILPVPAFYSFPETIDDIIDHVVGKVLAHLGIENSLLQTWEGK